jgi:hypothetical protein
MKRNLTLLICLTVLGGLISLTAFGQRATSFDLTYSEELNNCKLYITVNGKKRMINEVALDAWLLNKGKEVAFTTRGRGWDGEALWLYDVAANQSRQIISIYDLRIWDITEANLSNGARAILVELVANGDAGDGSLQFAVINPQRGHVLYRESAKLTSVSGDKIKLSFYKDKDWVTDEKRRLRKKAKPYKTEVLDLKKVLKYKVIPDEMQ